MLHEQVRPGGGQPPPAFRLTQAGDRICPTAYQRWSGACSGSFGAERIVFDGKTGPLNFAVDDDDRLGLHVETIGRLGSMGAVRR
ncbi:hypothetical protein EUU23_10470 [Sphingorhabdus sp. IMCC26285]|uniref:Uncharacterized protein n=1 Tax=Sphingorhabdus profundilacus TaxID=2509718 RepID=A0A6I4M1J2_9SPHN|nr:hypothetical protein [Sphingorhabdus profundilacus]MVZ98116.1 hypothetical protein [Sphingorhabdus profundilacus]